MSIVNGEKVQKKYIIKKSIESNQTNLMSFANEIRQMISCVDRAFKGSLVSTDRLINDSLHRNSKEISKAVEFLYQALKYVEELEVEEQETDYGE